MAIDPVVAEGGRLIVGKYNELFERRTIEEQLVEWGFHVTGRVERAWADEPLLAHRAVWIDGAPRP